MDRQPAALAKKLGFGLLAFNSGLAIYRSWGDAGSVAFVLAANAALVLLFVCLREFDRALGGDRAAAGMNMGGQYSALAKVGLAVLTCNAALHANDARRGPGSAALVFVSYAALVALTGLLLRAFTRAHGR